MDVAAPGGPDGYCYHSCYHDSQGGIHRPLRIVTACGTRMVALAALAKFISSPYRGGRAMTGDRLIRAGTALVVVAVASFAAVVSFSHIYDLGRAHGQAGTAARLLPLSVDGLILAASLVLLHEARNGRDAPALARVMLWLGIGGTVGANVAYGSAFGLLGAVISAWPAISFIGAVEMVMLLVRRSRDLHEPAVAPAARLVPGDVEEAVKVAYRASVAAGAPLSQRAMAERFGLSRRKVAQLVSQASAEASGSRDSVVRCLPDSVAGP